MFNTDYFTQEFKKALNKPLMPYGLEIEEVMAIVKCVCCNAHKVFSTYGLEIVGTKDCHLKQMIEYHGGMDIILPYSKGFQASLMLTALGFNAAWGGSVLTVSKYEKFIIGWFRNTAPNKKLSSIGNYLMDVLRFNKSLPKITEYDQFAWKDTLKFVHKEMLERMNLVAKANFFVDVNCHIITVNRTDKGIEASPDMFQLLSYYFDNKEEFDKYRYTDNRFAVGISNKTMVKIGRQSFG